MRKLISTINFLILTVTAVFPQGTTLKEKALEEFRKEHYSEAIGLLETAVRETPGDAEIYYYLGWFNHYRAYDSRPLSGYDYAYSQKIFGYLDKALELRPDYGDAKYFYGAECSGNAFLAMQDHDARKLRYYYELASEKGAYPEWLKEFGKNLLMNCAENAILFTGGNADFDVASYLQLCENFRTDITVIPIGNIDRPWYVRFLKYGLKNAVRKVTINLTDRQIMDIHPFKWDTTDVLIRIAPGDRTKFSLPQDYTLKWTVAPDLASERMHAKMESEKAKKRTFLSPQRAVLLQIVEDNFADRPVYFSNFASAALYGGLDEYFQDCGLVSRLTPVKTAGSDDAFDEQELEKLVRAENLTAYRTIREQDFPRISGVVLSGYSNAVMNLADLYKKERKTDKLDRLCGLYEGHLKIGFNPRFEQMVSASLKDQGAVTENRISVNIPTIGQEATSIWRTIRDISFFEKQGYAVNLPKDPLIDSLILKSKNGSFGDKDYSSICQLLESKIYDSNDYVAALKKIREQENLINGMIREIASGRSSFDYDFRMFDTYPVVLTLYGSGGSYDPDNGTVTLFTTKEGGFKNYRNPANTIIHEIVHIGIDKSIVEKYNLSHGMKERIVDAFVILWFGGQLPDYKIQGMGDPGIDASLKEKADLNRLNAIISKAVEK